MTVRDVQADQTWCTLTPVSLPELCKPVLHCLPRRPSLPIARRWT